MRLLGYPAIAISIFNCLVVVGIGVCAITGVHAPATWKFVVWLIGADLLIGYLMYRHQAR